jgi:hypothetical protein
MLMQSAQPDQVVSRCGEGEQPTDLLSASQLYLPQQAGHLQPSDALFHSFPFLLTDR